MISEYEQSEMFQKNYKAYEAIIKEHEKAYIEDLKRNRVLPLVKRMSTCNLDLYYKFRESHPETNNFIKNSVNMRAGISKQKHEYQNLIDELKEIGLSFHTSTQMQDEIFEVCTVLLDAAIKYDFPEQAIDTVKMMQDERIVGAKNCDFVAVDALRGVTKSYIKRYVHGSSKLERGAVKKSVKNLFNSALSGEFGDVKDMTEENLTPKEFKPIFKKIIHETQRSNGKDSKKA